MGLLSVKESINILLKAADVLTDGLVPKQAVDICELCGINDSVATRD
eukprot:SAG31_NODE_29485_length_394_cov_1.216949_1_plen_46_part_01